MQFALLIYGPEKEWAEATEEERAATYARYGEFEAYLTACDAVRGGAELAYASTGTTVRQRDLDADALVTDGPYAETVEQLGGFYLVEAPDEQTAIEYAKALPARTVEVRALVPPPA